MTTKRQSTLILQIIPVAVVTLLAAGAVRLVGVFVGESAALANDQADAQMNAPSMQQVDETVAQDGNTPFEEVAGSTQIYEAPATPLEIRLAERQQELDQRAREMETRERLLELAEQRIAIQSAKLQQDMQSLEQVKSELDDQRAVEFENLSNAYERMKSRDAARIFEVLDDEILIPVAAGMRTQSLSGVLAQMTPAKAEALTRKLAERQNGRKQTDAGQDRSGQ